MASRFLYPALGIALLAAIYPLHEARADAIDGNWCFKGGKTMSIDGPRIVTPGGAQMTGDYDRHGFAYTVPETEPGAGSKVTMILIDDDTLHLTTESGGGGAAKGPMQVWRRCDLTT